MGGRIKEARKGCKGERLRKGREEREKEKENGKHMR